MTILSTGVYIYFYWYCSLSLPRLSPYLSDTLYMRPLNVNEFEVFRDEVTFNIADATHHFPYVLFLYVPSAQTLMPQCSCYQWYMLEVYASKLESIM
jgi:hypothetical protein